MDLAQMYERFPTEDACLKYLEQVRWNGTPVCPYCESHNTTPLLGEWRHHCNGCNTSFSVTVRTVFRKTRIDLQKWFVVIPHVLDTRIRKKKSSRQLAEELDINKNTAWLMYERIRKYSSIERDLLLAIANLEE